MTTVNQKPPFIDPSNPNEIKIPEPVSMVLLEDTKVYRVVNHNKGISEGVCYDFKKLQFVLQIAELSSEELKGKVHLHIVNGDQKRTVEYAIGHLLKNSNLVKKEVLSDEVSALEARLEMDACKRIREHLIACYKADLEKYTKVYKSCEKHLSALPLRLHKGAVDCSSLIGQPDTELNPRKHNLTLAGQPEVSYAIHGSVIALNGGNIKTTFTISMKEKEDKEIQIPVSSRETLLQFIKYLYGVNVKIANEVEAVELFDLASLWEIAPLKELCLPWTIKQSLIAADPANLPTVEQFEATLGSSETEMVHAADQARGRIQQIYEIHLKPHIASRI